MKSINFINPVPPKKQHAFAVWLYASLALLLGLIALLISIYFNNMQAYKRTSNDLEELKKTTSVFETYVMQKKRLQQEKISLEERLNKLRSCSNNAQAPQELLMHLATITPPAVCLSTLQGTVGGKIVLEGVTRNAQAVTSFLNLLNNCTTLSDLTLTSLTPTEEKSPRGEKLMQFCLSGLWKQPNAPLVQG